MSLKISDRLAPKDHVTLCHNCGYVFELGTAGKCCEKPNIHFHNLLQPCEWCKHLVHKEEKR